MRKSIAFAIIFIAISVAQAADFESAPPAGNWNKVQSLPPNANITLELKNGEEISGSYARMTEDLIIYKEYEREKGCLKTTVTRVLLMQPGSRTRNAGIAGLISFAAGFGLGYAIAPGAADQNNMAAGERAGAGAAVGALLGGAAALIAAAHHPGPKKELIYKAR
jgi:hypothetical protein